jgi:hypothetical protein
MVAPEAVLHEEMVPVVPSPEDLRFPEQITEADASHNSVNPD